MKWALLVLASCRLITREVDRADCTVNTDCARDQLCFFTRCVPTSADPEGTVYVSIQPNATQPYFAQQQTLEVKDGRCAITWTTTSEWTGRTVSNSGDLISVGTIHLTKPSIIPGQTQTFNSLVKNSSEFDINLEPDTYQVTFSPAPESRGESSVGAWVVVEGTNNRQNIIYPSESRLITGSLLSSTTDTAPKIDASAYAIADGTGFLSTVAATDNAGHFTLQLSGAPSGATLYLGPSNANPFLPVLSQHVDLSAGTTSVPSVFMPGLGSTTTITGTVRGSLDGASPVIPGALVVATTTVGGGAYTTNTLTDDAGTFSLPVIRGSDSTPLSYALTLLPSAFDIASLAADQQFGLARTAYTLPTSGMTEPLAITLSSRSIVNGVLKDHKGATVENATVLARRFDDQGVDRVRAVTDSKGVFALPLDAGLHELTFTPLPGSALALARRLINVSNPEQDIEVALPAPALIGGELNGPAGLLDGANLSFYRLVNGLLVLAGEATANGSHFSVAVPVEEVPVAE